MMFLQSCPESLWSLLGDITLFREFKDMASPFSFFFFVPILPFLAHPTPSLLNTPPSLALLYWTWRKVNANCYCSNIQTVAIEWIEEEEKNRPGRATQWRKGKGHSVSSLNHR